MKLFNAKIGTQTINVNGTLVRFVNCIAEVDDALGAEVLGMGFPDLYEYGKQPVYETPREIRMQSDFAEKETWYQEECARLKNIAATRKERIKELEMEIDTWKKEYEKERAARVALAENMTAMQQEIAEHPVVEEAAEDTTAAPPTEDEIRMELAPLKKNELIDFAVKSGFTADEVADRTKTEIIDMIVESTK